MASKPGFVGGSGTRARRGGPSAGERPACGLGGARCIGGVSSSWALAGGGRRAAGRRVRWWPRPGSAAAARPASRRDRCRRVRLRAACAAAPCGPGRWWSARTTPFDVGAERAQRSPPVVTKRPGPCRFATCQVCFSVGEGGELGLPVRLEAAGHEAVVGVDGEVAPLRSGGVVAGPLDLASPMGQRGVMVGFEHLGGRHRGVHPGRGERGEEGGSDHRRSGSTYPGR